MKKDYKYVKKISKKNKDHFYFRFKGKYYPLPDINSPTFDGEYYRLREQFTAKTPRATPGMVATPGTVEAVVREYLESQDFKRLASATQRLYRASLDKIRGVAGSSPISMVTRAKILQFRDKLADTPGIANHSVTVWGVLMGFALDREHIEASPALGIKRLALGEYEPWPLKDIQDVCEQASPMLRLAIKLHLFTGQRISDVVKMTWNDIDGGLISVKQKKTGKELVIPIHSELQKELALLPKKAITLIYNEREKPFLPDTLRDRLKRVTKHHFHGLRKNAVNALLEAGCTEYEVQAITGQSPEMVKKYAKRVNQKILAFKGMEKLERNGNKNQKW